MKSCPVSINRKEKALLITTSPIYHIYEMSPTEGDDSHIRGNVLYTREGQKRNVAGASLPTFEECCADVRKALLDGYLMITKVTGRGRATRAIQGISTPACPVGRRSSSGSRWRRQSEGDVEGASEAGLRELGAAVDGWRENKRRRRSGANE